MKSLAVAVVALLASTASSPPGDAPRVAVRGTAQRSGSYCGGAAPSPQILKELATPHPLVERFDVLLGKEVNGAPAVTSFTPDGAGRFELSLPDGDYCVVRSARREESKNPVGGQFVDEACMRVARRACDMVWHIDATPVDGSFTLSVPCFGPCYRGPLPPAAAPRR